MSDPLRDTAPGESPARLLNASTFNLTMAAARWVRANGQVAAGRRGAPGAADGSNDARLEVRVRASDTLPQWGIITLGAAVIDPDVAPQNANSTPVFEAETPVANGVPAVLMQPLAAGRIGRAVVQGVCVAPVDVQEGTHRYAVPVVGDVFALKSAETGPFRLLTNPGFGSAQCLVMLGDNPPPVNWLAPVRAVATGNVDLSAPGGFLDSVQMLTGTRFLAPFQTDAKQNGVYVWNGASSAATRALDADSATYLAGASVVAQLGATYAASTWKCNLTPAATVGSDAIPWDCSIDRVGIDDTAPTGGAGVRNRKLSFSRVTGFGYPTWTVTSSGGITTIQPAGLYVDDAATGAPAYSGIQMLRFPAAHFTLTTPATGELQIVPVGGAGTVTEVSGGTPTDGVTVSVADGTSEPVITVTLADITPDSVTTGAVSGTTGTFSGALTADSLNGTYDAGTW